MGLCGCLLGLFSACEGERPTVHLNCATLNLPEGCGESCNFDMDCADGLHCTDEDLCTADCKLDADCSGSLTCDERGRCVTLPDGGGLPGDGSTADTKDCPSVVVDTEAVLPLVELLIDQSGSMDEDFGSTSRWEAVEDALVDPDTGVVTALEAQVIFGAALYEGTGGVCPSLTTVAPALNNYAAIDELFEDNGPGGDTPTGESLIAVTDEITAIKPDPKNPSPLYILLATDGEPDTCVQPNPNEGQAESIAGAEYAYAAGVETIVLSVGTDIAEEHLQDVANAGAGLPVGGTDNAPYYVATDPEELAMQIETIIGGARTCEFTLDGEVDPTRVDEGTVTLDGVPLVFGIDWDLLDSDTLILLGDACTTFLNDPDVILVAQFPCDVIIE